MEGDNYELAGRHWQSISRLNVIDNDEIDKLIGEHALPSIQRYVSGCVAAFKQSALGYQFEEAERQLALLHMLSNHFPNANLKINLVRLSSFLEECKKKRKEEQETTDKKLKAAKHEATQQVRAKTKEEIERLEARLRDLQTSPPPSHQEPDFSINVTFEFRPE